MGIDLHYEFYSKKCNDKEVLPYLEQEHCEDTISRQAVLDIFGYVMDYWREHAIDVEPYEIKDALIEQYEFTAKQLNELPSVTSQPKIGRWIDIDATHSKCDRCEAIFEIRSKNGEANYCPNCGAKMIETLESEVEE